jgi:hypothetical protein
MQSIFVLQLVPTDPWQDKRTWHSFYSIQRVHKGVQNKILVDYLIEQGVL